MIDEFKARSGFAVDILNGSPSYTLAQVLTCMPNVGEDEDFARNNDSRDANVFDRYQRHQSNKKRQA